MRDKEPRGTVLVVDDEPRLQDLVRLNLELEGFSVLGAQRGDEGLRLAKDVLPDLVILDVGLPDMDGFETLQLLRQVSTVPVLMLTVQASEQDRIRGLDLGADDYLAKPFSPRELASRARALLRRARMAPPPRRGAIVVDEGLTIDFDRREVHTASGSITLRPTEYRLLYHLVANAGRLVTREALLARVWGPEYRDEDHYLRLYITYLRQKIEANPAHPRYIFTERGLGYRFRELAADQVETLPEAI